MTGRLAKHRTRYAGWLWAVLRRAYDEYCWRRAVSPADRWLDWQRCSVDRLWDDAQHREAESIGREGK